MQNLQKSQDYNDKSKTLHQTVSTEPTLLLRNSAEIDGKGHTNIENMRQSENKI